MTPKQHEFLSLICDATQHEGDCTDNPLSRFWYPHTGNQWCKALKRDVWVDGAGVAKTLRSLEAKGWTKSHPNLHRYSYSITENGRVALEHYREQTGFYL